MKHQLQTIRAALELATDGPIVDREGMMKEALAALSELERLAGEPVYWQWRRKGHDWTLEYTFANEVQVTTKDSERRALYAAPPAQQPRVGTIGHVSAGKTTLIAAVTPLLKAQQPQAEAVQACGHPMSLLLRSAESNEPLYCEACDDKSGRHDAERRETELLDVKRHLQEKIASADALKLHAIEELCQLGYTVKDGELIPPDHLHKLVEAAGHPLTAPQQAEAVPPNVTRAGLFSLGQGDTKMCFHAGHTDPETLVLTLTENVTGGPYRAFWAYVGAEVAADAALAAAPKGGM